MVTVIILLIPILSLFSVAYLLRHNGKREVLRLDLVQFTYAFIFSPIVYIWLKSFLFYILKQELEVRLSATETFFIDTLFSVVFLYSYAFIVIHSLTKSFNLKKIKDPGFDIMEYSEFFHLWTSHILLYVGITLAICIISFVNLILPVTVYLSKLSFYFILLCTLITNVFVYQAIFYAAVAFCNKRQMKILKLNFIFVFLLHVLVYFIFEPKFNSTHIMYWICLMSFLSICLNIVFDDHDEQIGLWNVCRLKMKYLAQKIKNKIYLSS